MKSSWSSGFLVSVFLLSLAPDPATGQLDGPLFAMHMNNHATKAVLICTSESPSDTTRARPFPARITTPGGHSSPGWTSTWSLPGQTPTGSAEPPSVSSTMTNLAPAFAFPGTIA